MNFYNQNVKFPLIPTNILETNNNNGTILSALEAGLHPSATSKLKFHLNSGDVLIRPEQPLALPTYSLIDQVTDGGWSTRLHRGCSGPQALSYLRVYRWTE